MKEQVKKIIERNERLRANKMSQELEDIFKQIETIYKEKYPELKLCLKDIRDIFDAQCLKTEYEIKTAAGLEHLPYIGWQGLGKFGPNNGKIKRRLLYGKAENHKKEE